MKNIFLVSTHKKAFFLSFLSILSYVTAFFSNLVPLLIWNTEIKLMLNIVLILTMMFYYTKNHTDVNCKIHLRLGETLIHEVRRMKKKRI